MQPSINISHYEAVAVPLESLLVWFPLNWSGQVSHQQPPTAADGLLAAVVLQDVRVLSPKLVSYDVTVVGLHPPPAASHSHVFLLFV